MVLCLSSLVYGQDYQSLIRQADSCYLQKNYENAIQKLDKAFQYQEVKANYFYNGACVATLGGNKKLALKWLNCAFEKG